MTPEPHVFVDRIQNYPMAAISPAARRFGTQWCHLWCDPGHEADLHRVAQSLGMRRSWFQNRPRCPHYDLTPNTRCKALLAGVSERQWVPIPLKVIHCQEAGE